MAFLEVNNIRKKFGNDEVLRGIDFTLERGEVLAIIGSSGSGKTTLLRCLNFLEKANHGTITVDGDVVFDAQTFATLKDAEIRKNRLNFGLVFQQFNLFPHYTALKNVVLAPNLAAGKNKEAHAENEQKAKDLLARVGLADKMDFYPYQLSGGQQQRVAIARALALNPDILCFDEPTSALDPELTGEVLKVIKGLIDEDRTIIIVTHEMDFAKNVSDKIIFMADGIIEEIGTPDEVFNSPKSEKTKAFFRSDTL